MSVGEMIRAAEKKSKITSPKQIAQMTKGEKKDYDLLEELGKVQTAVGSETAVLWENIENK